MSDSRSESGGPNRISRFRSQAPERSPLKVVFGAALLLSIPLVAIGAVSDLSGLIFLFPPIGASAALIIGAPELPLSQPRNVALGHLASLVTGVAGAMLAPGSLTVGGIAGGVSFLLMLLTRSAHSPGVATAVMIVMFPPESVVLVSVEVIAAVMALIAVCWLIHRVRQVPYPTYWW